MANNIIRRVWNQNRMVNIEDLYGAAFQAEIGGHTFEISGIDDTGAAVTLSGTVSGVFRRPDNADIALTGSASNGVVSVTLSEDCYAVPGRFGLTIFVTSNSQKVAVYACVGTVAVSSTGNVAGDTPANVEDLIDDINAAIADLNTAIGSIPADYSQFMAAIAPAYSSSALYAVGSYAWYNGSLYRCITAITTAEAWTAAHWTAAVLGDDVSNLKSALEEIRVPVDLNLISVTQANEIIATTSHVPTITYGSNNSISAVLESTGTNTWGYAFPTESGKSYRISFDVVSGGTKAFSSLVTNNNSYSSSSYLNKITDIVTGSYYFDITANSSESSLWFSVNRQNQTCSISNIFVVDKSAIPWKYGNLQTALESEDFPPSAKAVGDIVNGFPNADWLNYNNLFDIKSTDLITDVYDSSLTTLTRTIEENNIHISSSPAANSYTSYKLNGLTCGKEYIIEFDCSIDISTGSNTNAKLTVDAKANDIGRKYATFSKAGNHYSCKFRAIDYAVTLAIFIKYTDGTIHILNIQIKEANCVNPPNTFCDYDGMSITTFHKCLCIGDSLTYGGFNADNVDPDVGIETLANKYSYPVFLEKLTGIDVTKIAAGGATSVSWWNGHKNDDLSGYDMAIIQLGVNDASPSHMGGWTQDSIDAFTNIITKLQNENKGIKVFVATTIPSPSYVGSRFDSVNNGIRQLVEDLADDDVILVDIQMYGHTADSEGYNAGHLTALGYNRLARDYVSLISYIIDTDKSNFRFIQFIGTELTYSDE